MESYTLQLEMYRLLPAQENEGQLRTKPSFTWNEARELGISNRRIYKLLRENVIEQLGRGLYRWTDKPPVNENFLEIKARLPKATICLSTALAHYDLIDLNPASIDIAIPRGTHKAKLETPVSIHLFNPKTFRFERSKSTYFGLHIYSPERCLVDVIRLPHFEGYEVGNEALRRWLRMKNSQPARLLDVAIKLNRGNVIRRRLETLL